MQWVDGVSLYDQARLRPPAPSQARRWLAQLSQALAVLHSQGALHRDLKGDNIRVRRSDGRAMLLDFGTGLYPGAAPLTPPMGFPGTSLYRSPESWLFEVRFHTSSTARYVATPADDLYALGVTACRLLTGEYPLLPEPFRDAHGNWHLRNAHLPPALLRSPSIEPSLRAFTLRLLSVQPEQRGAAAQLAQELEQTLKPFQRARTRHAAGWGAVAAASMAVAVWAWKAAPDNPAPDRSLAKADSADTGTTGLGDSATPSALEPAPSASTREAMSENTLPQPVPGQVRPDEKGHCPFKGLVSLNGACWAEATGAPEKCPELGGQMFKGSCYVPFIPPGRRTPSTSSPVQKP
jgi:serine/threonine protein kinase